MENRISGDDYLVGSMYCTSKVFQIWEKMNYEVLKSFQNSLKMVLCLLRLRRRQKRGTVARSRHIMGVPSLVELCFDKASLEEKREMADVLPDHMIESFIRRRRANAVLGEFFRGLVFQYKTKRLDNNYHLVVKSNESKTGNPNFVDRTIWDPSKLPLKTFIKLLRQCGRDNLRLRKEGAFDEFGHALFCLWLVNPVILFVLGATYVIGDVGVPFVRSRMIKLVQYLVAKLGQTKTPKTL